MLIRCPWCDVPSEVNAADVADAVLSCEVCGMRWNPADKAGARKPSVRKPVVDLVPVKRKDIDDGLVIDHVSSAFQGRVPPHRRPAKKPAASHRPSPRKAAPPTRPSQKRDLRVLKAAGAIFGALLLAVAVSVPFVSSLPASGGMQEDSAVLSFRNVTSHTVVRGGTASLVVEGELVNHSPENVGLPAIRVTLRAPDGQEIVSRLVEPASRAVAPGRAVGFRSAFAAPADAVAKVTLSLATQDPQIVGMR